MNLNLLQVAGMKLPAKEGALAQAWAKHQVVDIKAKKLGLVAG
jgi:hypothetical protein